MIASLVPPGVIVVDSFHEIRGRLGAVEEHAAESMRPARRDEFTTARLCAHRALGRLGIWSDGIGRGRAGEPLWPTGAVGSITHCAGYRAAAVAPTTRIAAVGIDAEPNAPLPRGVLERIGSPADLRCPTSLGGTRVHGDRLLFCAKEAAFKASFARTRDPLDWRRIAVDARGDGTFHARVRTAEGDAGLVGAWTVKGGLLAAAVVIPRDDA